MHSTTIRLWSTLLLAIPTACGSLPPQGVDQDYDGKSFVPQVDEGGFLMLQRNAEGRERLVGIVLVTHRISRVGSSEVRRLKDANEHWYLFTETVGDPKNARELRIPGFSESFVVSPYDHPTFGPDGTNTDPVTVTYQPVPSWSLGNDARPFEQVKEEIEKLVGQLGCDQVQWIFAPAREAKCK